MKIIVLIKEVPDTWGERRLDLSTGLADRAASQPTIDEINERAVELALTYKDANPDTEVVVMTMGPATATNTLRKALAMGATSAVHILDDRLAGSDVGWTSSALAAAIKREGFDLIIAGNESTDGRGGVVPAMVAEHLGVPHATSLESALISATAVSGERVDESETVAIEVELPAVISITERLPEGRFPSFKGTMTAKKRPLDRLDVGDLGVQLAESTSVIVSVAERPTRTAGEKIVDEGDAGRRIVAFLESKRLI